MTAYQRRWLLLLAVGVFSLCGANCPRGTYSPFSPQLPRVLPPSPKIEDVIAVVNNNSRQIQSLSADRATINVRGVATSLSASLAYQRPQRLRLRAGTSFGTELDLGSNDEFFWIWAKRNQPQGIYYCRHDHFITSRARDVMPLGPQGFIEALGVVEFDPALPHQGPFPYGNGNLRIDTIREMPEPLKKVTIIDGQQGWVLEQYWYNAQGQVIASATAAGHHRDPLTNIIIPSSVQIAIPQTQLNMRIELGNVEVNRLQANSTALWTPSAYPGSPWIDMGDPNFQPPMSPPPVAARQPPTANYRQRPAW
jgi:hypothetical protein